jgi:hypothetical protein
MLDDKQKKQLETCAVEMILAIRGAYLSEQSGRPAMNYWEQIQNRCRAAARQTTTASEWVSAVQRRMQIPALRSSDSSALIELVRFCDENSAHQEFLAMVERDCPLLIALTQLIVEERKKANATDAV